MAVVESALVQHEACSLTDIRPHVNWAPASRPTAITVANRSGEPAITTANPGLVVAVVRDGEPIEWKAVAKDGFDLSAAHATSRPGGQPVSNGEIYDFEVTPSQPGDMAFEVRSSAGALLVSMPIRVAP